MYLISIPNFNVLKRIIKVENVFLQNNVKILCLGPITQIQMIPKTDQQIKFHKNWKIYLSRHQHTNNFIRGEGDIYYLFSSLLDL